ncbi:MAG: AMP-binding protein [Spirochaetes bacterium]|nr:AMP-binding protein [Spirochaetota bacterium]
MKIDTHETANIHNLLERNAAEKPDAPFFIINHKAISYSAGLSVVEKLAGYLRKIGICEGDRVVLNLGNNPEFIFCFLAVAQIGAISVLVNPLAKRYELASYVNASRPALVITDSSQMGNFQINNEFIFPADKIINIDNSMSGNNLLRVIEGMEPYKGYSKKSGKEAVSIIFTSAIEGEPLGAMVSHACICDTSLGVADYALDNDMFMAVLPLFHIFGLISSFISPLLCGLPFYLIGSFSPRKIIEFFRSTKASIFIGVPIMYQIFDILFKDKVAFPNMRLWISGGEALSPALQIKFRAQYNIDIRQGYGLTEASPIVAWNNTRIDNKIGTVGTPMPWNEVKIMLEGKEAATGESGEVVVRGDSVTSGYYGRPDKTAEVLAGGWLHTGDIGSFDDVGYLTIKGRKKNMIIKNGLNVYPREVERIMRHHPSIREAYVRPVISESDGVPVETLSATVYSAGGGALTVENIIEWCQDNMSKYKIPDVIVIKD